MNRNFFNRIGIWIILALVFFTVFRQFEPETSTMATSTSYTQFMDDAKAGKIARVDIKGREITVTPVEGQKYVITSPGDLWMVDDLRKDGVQVYGDAGRRAVFLDDSIDFLVPDVAFDRRVGVFHASDAGRRKRRSFQFR